MILGEGRTKHAAIGSNCEVLGSDEGTSSFKFFSVIYSIFLILFELVKKALNTNQNFDWDRTQALSIYSLILY